MQIKFADGTTIENKTAIGERLNVRNFCRDTITFIFDPEKHTTEELLGLFTDLTKTRLMVLLILKTRARSTPTRAIHCSIS